MRGPNGPSPPAALENIGTRDIDSTPPAITKSYCPAITPAAPKCAACWLDPHCLSIVTPVTSSGKPAASAAFRPTLKACSPTCETAPQMTSSTIAGSMPVRSTKPWSTIADRSTGWIPLSAPFSALPMPTGLRTAPTMTASRTILSPLMVFFGGCVMLLIAGPGLHRDATVDR